MYWNKWCFFLVIAFTVFLNQIGLSQPLIEAGELKNALEKNTVLVIDVRQEKDFDLGHIPHAIQLWRSDFSDTTLPYSGMLAPKEALEALLGNNGISEKDQLVLYDDRSSCDAARLWWALDRYGFSSIRLLNGGLSSWKSAGFALSDTHTSRQAVRFTFSGPEYSSRIATLEEVKSAINDAQVVLLDCRSEKEFLGKQQAKGAFRAGRIPGSIHIDWKDATQSDHRFLPISEIEHRYAQALPDRSQPIIVYCQSGARSAHTTFVLTQLLGYQNVKNYDGSWIEWSFHNQLAIETGPSVAAAQQAGVNYLELIRNSYRNYARYMWHEVTHPSWHNYFYWLLLVSLLFFLIELVFPWRENQATFRKDFWLDFFYMFFNFFIFSLIVYNAASDVVVTFFHQCLAAVGINNLLALEVQQWPVWAHLLCGFVVRDFVQWWIHRLLHRSAFLWEFHKVHHSVEQMGFAAHLRYHWMENVVYRGLEYLPLALIGIGLNDFFIIHIFALTIGHWNHSNFKLNIGPLKYLFNNPQMHIWHHAYYLPKERKYGVNFGLTLSVWDYLFGTNYIPKDGKDIPLGFPGVESFPADFLQQNAHGIIKNKH
jgi:3-mercaptopyruvate sulfurtransferase SseA/sterol desaturase/sphingolipid hydroxylase (fatty acid hydroxylase superfamily)